MTAREPCLDFIGAVVVIISVVIVLIAGILVMNVCVSFSSLCAE